MATYTVKTGDSWEKIAGEVYGNQRMFLELAKANRGIYVLRPGQVLDLPPAYESPFVSNEAAMARGMAPATAFNEKGELKAGWTKTATGGYTNYGALTTPSLGGTTGLNLPTLPPPPGSTTIGQVATPTTTPQFTWHAVQVELARLGALKNYQVNPTKYTLPPRISDYTLQKEYTPESIPEAMTGMGYQKVGTDWVLPGSLAVSGTLEGYVVPPTPYSSEWYQAFSAGLEVPPPYYYSPYAQVVQTGNGYQLVPFGQEMGGGGGTVETTSVTGRTDMWGALEGLFAWRPGW